LTQRSFQSFQPFKPFKSFKASNAFKGSKCAVLSPSPGTPLPLRSGDISSALFTLIRIGWGTRKSGQVWSRLAFKSKTFVPFANFPRVNRNGKLRNGFLFFLSLGKTGLCNGRKGREKERIGVAHYLQPSPTAGQLSPITLRSLRCCFGSCSGKRRYSPFRPRDFS